MGKTTINNLDPSQTTWPPCDVCGQYTSTMHVVSDTMRRRNFKMLYLEGKPVNKRVYCSEHLVEPVDIPARDIEKDSTSEEWVVA